MTQSDSCRRMKKIAISLCLVAFAAGKCSTAEAKSGEAFRLADASIVMCSAEKYDAHFSVHLAAADLAEAMSNVTPETWRFKADLAQPMPGDYDVRRLMSGKSPWLTNRIL